MHELADDPHAVGQGTRGKRALARFLVDLGLVAHKDPSKGAHNGDAGACGQDDGPNRASVGKSVNKPAVRSP
jgi:hypothetical protein